MVGSLSRIAGCLQQCKPLGLGAFKALSMQTKGVAGDKAACFRQINRWNELNQNINKGLCSQYASIRQFSQTASTFHATKCPKGEGYKVNFITQDGDKITVSGREGENILEIAHANDVDLEGACECSLACSTCHVIVDDNYYDRLEEPSDEENDMLDLAFGLTETSRLGCQIHMNKELDGITVKIPSATRNVQFTKM